MTHACINSLSQILVNEEVWLSLVSKILIISLAIWIARKKYVTLKEKNEQIYFKTISRYLVCTWLPLLATFLVGQVILWCFPDRE